MRLLDMHTKGGNGSRCGTPANPGPVRDSRACSKQGRGRGKGGSIVQQNALRSASDVHARGGGGSNTSVSTARAIGGAV